MSLQEVLQPTLQGPLALRPRQLVVRRVQREMLVSTSPKCSTLWTLLDDAHSSRGFVALVRREASTDGEAHETCANDQHVALLHGVLAHEANDKKNGPRALSPWLARLAALCFFISLLT